MSGKALCFRLTNVDSVLREFRKELPISLCVEGKAVRQAEALSCWGCYNRWMMTTTKLGAELRSGGLYPLPVAAVRKCHKLSGVKQQTSILSQVWRPDI